MKGVSLFAYLCACILLVCTTMVADAAVIGGSDAASYGVANHGPLIKRGSSPAHPEAADDDDAAAKKDKEKGGEETEVAFVPDAAGKQLLRNMVEDLVKLVTELRANNTKRLPDQLERLFKDIAEKMDTLQDMLKTDLNIDLGNLLNSSGL
ncbi:hypothetical protein BC940DRAFT_306542 [Gongronella butleri]|nr:hypothetical protein BC940DRAFT_306542 [Gongronella butleri]